MISVVLNPKARMLRRRPTLVETLGEVVGSAGSVSLPDGLQALDRWAEETLASGCRRIAICGGDGSAHQVLTAIDRIGRPDDLQIMFLHGGTMNTVSRSMGQRGRPADQLRSWVAELNGGPTLERVYRAPLRVQGTYTGFLFGIGIVPRFIEAYEGTGEPSPGMAAWTLARAVGSAFTGGAFAKEFFRGIEAEVQADDTIWPTRAWKILTAGAVQHIGLSFEPFPGVLKHRGHMHVFATASTPAGFARDLIPLRLGRPATDPNAHDQVCRRLVIRTKEALRYNLDGDLYDTGTEIVVESSAEIPFVLSAGCRPIS